MDIARVIPQLRTTNLAAAIEFYTGTLGFTLMFEYEGFYAGIRAGDCVVHLKLTDGPDPSIAFVDREEHFHLYFETSDVAGAAEALKRAGATLAREVHDTPWGTRECVVKDTDGHTLYFGQRV